MTPLLPITDPRLSQPSGDNLPPPPPPPPPPSPPPPSRFESLISSILHTLRTYHASRHRCGGGQSRCHRRCRCRRPRGPAPKTSPSPERGHALVPLPPALSLLPARCSEPGHRAAAPGPRGPAPPSLIQLTRHAKDVPPPRHRAAGTRVTT